MRLLSRQLVADRRTGCSVLVATCVLVVVGLMMQCRPRRSGTKVGARRPSSSGTKWQEQHQKVREKLGFVDTGLVEQDRCQDLIAIAEEAVKVKQAKAGQDEQGR